MGERFGRALARTSRRGTRTWIVIGVVAVIVVAAGSATLAATGSSGPDYRTATAVRATVAQTLDSTGVVSPASQASVTFPVSGTVASVAVTPGDHVEAGQTLATLDAATLSAAVDSAAATLATDQAKLISDEAGEGGLGASTAAGSTASYAGGPATIEPIALATGGARPADRTASTSTTPGPTDSGPASSDSTASGSTASRNGGAVAAARAAITKAQKSLITAQRTADADLAVATTDLGQEKTTCAAFIDATATAGTAAPPATDGSPATAAGPSPAGAGRSGGTVHAAPPTQATPPVHTAPSAHAAPPAHTTPPVHTDPLTPNSPVPAASAPATSAPATPVPATSGPATSTPASSTPTVGQAPTTTGASASVSAAPASFASGLRVIESVQRWDAQSVTSAVPAATGTAAGTAAASACSALLSTVLTDQQLVSTAQGVVTQDEATLGNAIETLVAPAPTFDFSESTPSTGGSTSTDAAPGRPAAGTATAGSAGGAGGAGGARSARSGGSGGASGSSGSARSGGAASSARGGAQGVPASPAQIAADQATVDAAQAALTQAKDELIQTTLVSPLAGTVGAVGLTVGESVQAASTASGGSGITVIGAGTSYEVETSVTDSDLAKVRVGQAASAIVDGSTTALTGKVVGIGLLPTSSLSSGSSSSSGGAGASSSVSYPVTISLNRASQRIFSGSDADVSIVIAQAANAIAVPSSALRSLGQLHTVTVVRGGKATATIVGVGAAGTTLTQITSGLKVGDRVVLADLSTPLPSAGGTTNGRGGGLGGAFGGGGLGAGGLNAGGLGGGRAGGLGGGRAG
ncbi:HlyD family efflux transporter periplasmic adaptor subunit [Frankia sp. ACN1ag]|uniref:HlyD family efflux transporter periplasmic adaptor subunit n=1 Tax=Frankia sp. ACN1ag TaxID=102891 RepID=UPI0006DD10AD|nr:biotin/lipoyl-binding protein [Frankia sp. ACN1ag]KQC39607.1 hypothetical protein UK82_02785 [Frankia sp. ACN1ag]